VRDAEELHDVLLSLVAVRPQQQWNELFGTLAAAGRAFEVHPAGEGPTRWAPTERRGEIEVLFEDAALVPDYPAPPGAACDVDEDEAADALARGHLEVVGPVTVADLAARSGLAHGALLSALERLRASGFAISGEFEPDGGEQWCARRLLARIHGYSRDRRRAEVRAVSRAEWQEFLLSWWHAAPGSQLEGRAGLAEVIEQMQGFECPAGEWEQLLAQRVSSYRPEWLDDLCLSGEVLWGRLSLLEAAADPGEPAAGEPRRSGRAPSRRTPITFMMRGDVPWLLQAHRGNAVPAEPTAGSAREVLDTLRSHGAQFHPELQAITKRLPTEIEEGLWDGVARGLVTADGFNAVRSLLNARTRSARRRRPRPGSRGRRGTWRAGVEGRWTLLPAIAPIDDADELAEAAAWQLLARWGVVFRDVYLAERLAVPWREVLWALRRLEARGLVRGGHFVAGVTGEQFADETATAHLRGRRAS